MFTAAIWGVFTCVTASEPTFDPSAMLTSNVDQINAGITRDWAALDKWDNDTYSRQMTLIAQTYNSGLINDDARKSLYDRVNREAYTTAAKAMDEQFRKTGCDETLLADNYNGLMVIAAKEPGIEKVPDVEQAERLYVLYRKVKDFNNRSLRLRPHFNGNDQSWSPSFSAFATNIQRTRDDILSNPDFRSRLSHITEMKKIYQTDNKLNEARVQYFNDLYSQIESYYTSLAAQYDRTSEEWESKHTEFKSLMSDVYKESGDVQQINRKLHYLRKRLWE